MPSDAASAIRADERRAARDSYRAAGGSARRPLKSFTTTDERQEARLEHAANLRAACEALSSPEGFRDWVGALMLNPAVSPLNAALIASQAPGRVVTTTARWKAQGYSVRKGESAYVRITAPGFKPRAAFDAEQVGATDILAALEADPPRLPSEDQLETLRDELSARLAADDKATRVIGAYGAEIAAGTLSEPQEGESVFEACGRRAQGSDAIPF